MSAWERIKAAARLLGWRVRVDLCFDESDGFDIGAFVGDWKAAWGPFLLHRQMEGWDNFNQYDPGPEKLSSWRLMIALTPAAYRGFDEGAIK